MRSDSSSLSTLGAADEMYDSFYEMLYRTYYERFLIVTRVRRKKLRNRKKIITNGDETCRLCDKVNEWTREARNKFYREKLYNERCCPKKGLFYYKQTFRENLLSQ